MAKGNMFLGMARGKVGDVVFYRADGQQLSRVRNRNPRNPRSNSQLFQRAIMATIVQAYTAGKAIFDHSFQGYSVGAQNQRKFISENAKKLREAIAADINTPITTNQQTGRVVAPGTAQPVPFSYVISKGSYKQELFFEQDTASFNISLPEENEKVKDFVARLNLIAGDIYTFVLFVPNKKEVYTSNVFDDVLASQNYCDFAFVRLTVKNNLSTNEEVLSKYGQLFEIEQPGTVLKSAEEIADFTMITHFDVETLIADNETYMGTGAIGVIRSRKDEDLRSDSTLSVLYGTTAEDMFGIASDYLLDAWRAGTSSIGNSDLILEGGDV